MLADSDFSFLDILSKLVVPGVSILLSTLLALYAIHRADLREHAKRRRDELVALANEFMELAKKLSHELGGSVESYKMALPENHRKMRENFKALLALFDAQSLHLVNKLRLLDRHGLIQSAEEFSSAAHHAHDRLSVFSKSIHSNDAERSATDAISALSGKQQECFELFIATLRQEEAELRAGFFHRMRRRIGTIFAGLCRHFGCE